MLLVRDAAYGAARRYRASSCSTGWPSGERLYHFSHSFNLGSDGRGFLGSDWPSPLASASLLPLARRGTELL